METSERLAEVLKADCDNLLEIIDDISIFQKRMWFAKAIQQYEIFKLAMDRPGSIVELGVFKGHSLFNWARFVEMYNMGEKQTKIIGFDSFTGFTHVHEKDKTELNQQEAGPYAVTKGGFNAGERSYERLMKLVEIFELDHFEPHIKRIEIVKGDIVETVPEYVRKNPGLRIALLHLDCDLYEPTMAGLKYLYPLVVSGGVVILDEYSHGKFAGESAAFDEYFSGRRPELIKSRLHTNPSAYFVKQG
jgi:hypothetical protein